MRIATWNVNSVRSRYDRICSFLERSDVDVLCLQETKCTDSQFPDFSGYKSLHHGSGAFNGVAILSREEAEPLGYSFGQPGFSKDLCATPTLEARALGARYQGVEIWSLYVPNGRDIADPHYTYKLRWLDSLRNYALQQNTPLCLCGDFNIIPSDDDLWDTEFFRGKTHVTVREREALRGLESAGLTEATHSLQGQYTYWDYQSNRFAKDEGIRIDLHFTKELVTDSVWIDREERRGAGASDHAPVILDCHPAKS